MDVSFVPPGGQTTQIDIFVNSSGRAKKMLPILLNVFSTHRCLNKSPLSINISK